MTVRRDLPVLPILLVSGTALYGAYLVRDALLPFVLSFALAYVVDPLIDAVETRGLRRFHIVLGFYLLTALLLFGLGQFLVPLMAAESARLQAMVPTYLAKAQAFTADLQLRATKGHLAKGLPLAEMTSHAFASAAEQVERLPSFLLGLFPLLSLLFLVPFITFFLLLDGPFIVSSLIQATPSRTVEQTLHLLNEIDASLGHYLRGILIVALAIAAASYLGLLALGVNGAPLIALLSGVSSFVPYLGAIVGALVGGAVAFLQFGKLSAGLKVVLLFLGIRLADESLLQPFIAKYSVHLHPLLFLLSMMIGGEVFGFLGLVFAIPAACILKALLRVAWEWYVSEARLAGGEAQGSVSVPYT